MHSKSRPRLVAIAVAASLTLLGQSARAEKYGLEEGKPHAGTTLNILSVVTPQFDGLMLRDEEFTELTGIETEWTFIPFGSLQEKITAEGVAANGAYDVVNYLDSWGPPNVHWLERTDDQVAFAGMPSYEGETVTYAISMPFSISSYSDNKEAAWEFLKWLSNPEMDKANAIEREVAGKPIVNNVVTHVASLQDPEVNAANANIQEAAWQSLESSDIMPQIPEWPEVGDILSGAIAEAAGGGDVRELMNAAADQATKVLRRAGRID